MEKNNKSNHAQYTAGFTIIYVAMLMVIVSITSFSVYFNSIDLNYSNNIISKSKNAELNKDDIFNDIYYKSIDLLSKQVYYGTTWLSICPNSQIEINNSIYIKVCDKYNSVKSIKNSLNPYFSSLFIDQLMGDDYIDLDGSLYIKPLNIEKDSQYAGLDSYVAKDVTDTSMEFIVKSRYVSKKCSDSNCMYTKSHNIKLIKEGNKWIISDIEMPY